MCFKVSQVASKIFAEAPLLATCLLTVRPTSPPLLADICDDTLDYRLNHEPPACGADHGLIMMLLFDVAYIYVSTYLS